MYGLIIELSMKNYKSTELVCLRVLTIYTNGWVHLNFDMSNAAMLFFLRDSQLCVSLEQHPISFDGLPRLDWHFVEVSHHAYRAG